MMPISAAKVTIRTVQEIPIFADFFRLVCDSRDMKRMMMCGMPK